MEFFINRDPLLKILGRIQSIVERRNTMPILANALLTAKEGQVAVSATDLEVSLNSVAEADVSEPGTITVAARKLFDIVRELPDEQIRIKKDDGNRLTVTCGRARFNLVGLPGDDFPPIPEPQGAVKLSIAPADLSEMFAKTHFAMSQDETRFTLNGILLQMEPAAAKGERNLIRFVATDTHRLALVESPAPDDVNEAREAILPKKAVNEARKLLEEDDQAVELVIGQTHVHFLKPDISLVSKLVDGKFPNYQRVVPKNNDKTLSIDKEEIQGVVKRMSVLSNEKSKGIRLEIGKTKLKVTTSNPENEDAEEEMTATFNGPEDISIGFNARYMQEIFQALDGDSVQMILRDDESPVLVKDPEAEHFLFVLMPMRI